MHANLNTIRSSSIRFRKVSVLENSFHLSFCCIWHIPIGCRCLSVTFRFRFFSVSILTNFSLQMLMLLTAITIDIHTFQVVHRNMYFEPWNLAFHWIFSSNISFVELISFYIFSFTFQCTFSNASPHFCGILPFARYVRVHRYVRLSIQKHRKQRDIITHIHLSMISLSFMVWHFLCIVRNFHSVFH